MDTLTKKMFSKLYLIYFLAFSFLLFSERNVEAKFIKKITVESFSDPVDWEKSFKPGKFFSLMLENSLTDSGIFQMVRLNEIEPNKIHPDTPCERAVLDHWGALGYLDQKTSSRVFCWCPS